MTQLQMFPEMETKREAGFSWVDSLLGVGLNMDLNKLYDKVHKRRSIVRKYKLADDFWAKYGEMDMWASLQSFLTPKESKPVNAKRAWSNFVKYSEEELKQYYTDVEVRVSTMKARLGIGSIQ